VITLNVFTFFKVPVEDVCKKDTSMVKGNGHWFGGSVGIWLLAWAIWVPIMVAATDRRGGSGRYKIARVCLILGSTTLFFVVLSGYLPISIGVKCPNAMKICAVQQKVENVAQPHWEWC
jgi:hypothetical protein